jgi:hypothetical protein
LKSEKELQSSEIQINDEWVYMIALVVLVRVSKEVQDTKNNTITFVELAFFKM